jgi:hypothetical protein
MLLSPLARAFASLLQKYGDKIDATLQGPDGGPIQTEHTIVEYIRQKDKKDPV